MSYTIVLRTMSLNGHERNQSPFITYPTQRFDYERAGTAYRYCDPGLACDRICLFEVRFGIRAFAFS